MPRPILFKHHLLALLAACLIQTSAAHAALIALQPATTYANTGDAIAFDLVISDLGNFAPDSLGAFDITVGFDNAALAFTSYSLGNLLGDVDLFEAIDASSGLVGATVNVAQVSLVPALDLQALQPGAFTLATLNFSVTDLAVGAVTQLSILSNPVLGDAYGSAIAATTASPATIQGGAAAVPVSGTPLLLLAALLAWLTLNRRSFTPSPVTLAAMDDYQVTV